MIKRIDTYILTSFLTYFAVSLCVLLVLFLSVDLMSSLNRFEVGGTILLSYYINYLPWIAYHMAPISALLAMVFLMTRLVKSSELTALFASGYGLFRIIGSVLVFLVFLTVGMFWFGDQVMPTAMDKRYYIYYVEMKKDPNRYSKTRQKNIWYKTEDAIIHFNEILSPNNVAGVQLFFIDPESWRLQSHYEAKNLTLKDGVWVLTDGQKSQYDKTSEKFRVSDFKEAVLPAVTQVEDMQVSGEATENLSLKDLRHLIRQNERIGLQNHDIKVIYWSKFSFALTALILPLLGLSMTSVDRRGGNAFLGASIGGFMVLAYWILYSSTLSIGKAGFIPPFAAAFMVPMLGFILIAALIQRVLK